jgi:TGF-beta propeptide
VQSVSSEIRFDAVTKPARSVNHLRVLPSDHRLMRRLLFLLAVVVAGLAGPAAGGARTLTISPSADVGLPFWCDWGYDWESRCFRDDGPRLPIGGVDDKVWRAALRFSLAAVPAWATVTSAELRVYHDGVCVAPGRGSAPCVPPGAVIDAHRILSASWFAEREVELDERVLETAVVFAPSEPQWLVWNLTRLVQSWHRGQLANNGVLLKLQDGDEGFGVPGPYGPSSSYPDPELRPRLVVTFSRHGSR